MVWIIVTSYNYMGVKVFKMPQSLPAQCFIVLTLGVGACYCPGTEQEGVTPICFISAQEKQCLFFLTYVTLNKKKKEPTAQLQL